MNTFYHGDCLFVLRHDILPESVDLIYLDPPFFTGKIQKGKWQPGAMEVSYEDSKKFWSEKADVMREKAPAWLRHVALERPDFASYLYYMMVRLEACYTVIKPTGSIYLHCDYRALHYLKMIMDELFGYDNFRNDIIWHYTIGGRTRNTYPRKHDNILFYSKSKTKWLFNSDDIKVKYDANMKTLGGVKRIDEKGRPYRETWGTGSKKVYRYYLDEGKIPEDVWYMESINSNSPERVGYPTQKPLALLERIIQASSNEGDLVLDPFCGCGTCIIAAYKFNRQWIGIDINKFAYDTTKGREKQLPLGMKEEFKKARYITRDLEEVKELNPSQFEAWVNEYYKATKPHPDKGVDGITHDGIPIQVKIFEISYKVLSQFITDAKYHPNVPQPIKKVIVVSQTGFDDGARKRKFEIETAENIEVVITTPAEMLKLETT